MWCHTNLGEKVPVLLWALGAAQWLWMKGRGDVFLRERGGRGLGRSAIPVVRESKAGKS